MTKRICADRTCRDCGADIEDLPKGTRRCIACVLDIMRDVGLEPLEPYPGPNAPWLCRCVRCGSEVTPRFGNIAAGVSKGCRPCGLAASADAHRESEESAVASMRAAGFEPLVPYPGTVLLPWASQCMTCGERVSPTLNNVRRGSGCWYCAGFGQDDRDPVEVMRAADLEPLTPFPGTHAPWPCICMRCGLEVDPYYKSIKAGHGCRWCNSNALDPEAAAAMMRQAGFEPHVPYPGALKPWPSRCMKCGQDVAPHYCSIQQGRGGCRWCQKAGFRAVDDAVVYLLVHPGYDAAKVGVTHKESTRLRDHQARGWDIWLALDVTGPRALAIETAVLDWWRKDLELPVYLGREEMPQAGWTETVAACEIDLAATLRWIQQLAYQR